MSVSQSAGQSVSILTKGVNWLTRTHQQKTRIAYGRSLLACGVQCTWKVRIKVHSQRYTDNISASQTLRLDLPWACQLWEALLSSFSRLSDVVGSRPCRSTASSFYLKINISQSFPLTARCVTHTVHMEIYHCHDAYMSTVIIISNVALRSRKRDERWFHFARRFVITAIIIL